MQSITDTALWSVFIQCSVIMASHINGTISRLFTTTSGVLMLILSPIDCQLVLEHSSVTERRMVRTVQCNTPPLSLTVSLFATVHWIRRRLLSIYELLYQWQRTLINVFILWIRDEWVLWWQVTSLITQGRSDGKEWVTSYMVSYSAYDQQNWQYITDQYGNRKVLHFYHCIFFVPPAAWKPSVDLHIFNVVYIYIRIYMYVWSKNLMSF